MPRWAFAFFNLGGGGLQSAQTEKINANAHVPKTKNNSQKKGATFRLLLFIIKDFDILHHATHAAHTLRHATTCCAFFLSFGKNTLSS